MCQGKENVSGANDFSGFYSLKRGGHMYEKKKKRLIPIRSSCRRGYSNWGGAALEEGGGGRSSLLYKGKKGPRRVREEVISEKK